MKYLGSALAFWRVLRGIAVDDVRRMADLGFAILITGPSHDDCDALGSYLRGTEPPTAIPDRSFRQIAWPVPPAEAKSVTQVDLIVYVTEWGRDVPEADIDALRRAAKGLTPLVVVRHGPPSSLLPANRERGPSGVFKKTIVLDRLEPAAVESRVAPVIVDLLPDHVVSLGRKLPPFRRAAAAKVIDGTTWTNTQFAAISNLPAIIPVVGNLIAVTADLLVLTRNQIMMLLKLAAIFGRDVKNQRSVIMEILPVVGGALLWRTVARELADLLPALLGAVPKILVAGAGTYAVGQAAAFYYSQGHKPSAKMIREYYATAAKGASKVLPDLRTGSKARRTPNQT